MDRPVTTRRRGKEILAGILASSLLCLPAVAETSNGAAKSNNAAPDAQSILKFSEDGNTALRDIEAARIAIFTGEPSSATAMIAKARSDLAKAEQAAELIVANAHAAKAGAKPAAPAKIDMIPVDGQLVLADDFVPTAEKQSHIAAANEKFKNGKRDEGLKELRLGEVQIVYNRLWMPVASALKHLDQATSFLADHKYYEANLALKAIGDGLTVESMSLNETPKAAPEQKAQ